MTWNDNATGEDGYKIERKAPGGGFAGIAETGPNVTTATDSGLNPSTEYTYRVRAFNAIPVASAYSNETFATTFSGGGCSVGKRTHGSGDVDTPLVLLQIVAIWGLARGRRGKE